MKIKISLLALAFLFSPACAFADVNKSGTLSSNETWSPSSGVYVITDNFTIPTGVTLTIDPGTIIKIMPSGPWSQILFTVSGTLSAIGTPSQNITFTSYKDDIGGDTNGNGVSTGTPGDWAAIVVNSTGTANFSYSKISYAGRGFSYGPYYADVYNDGGNLFLTNSIISSSENSGIVHAGGVLSVVSTTFQDNTIGINAFGSSTVSVTGSTFTNNTKAGTFAFQDGLKLSTSGNTVSGTGMNGFGISGTISTSQTWKADTIPYVITDNFTIPQGVTLALDPGTIVKIMPSGPWSQILFTVSGTLSAIGTSAQNIIFTSYKDNIGGDTNGDSSATSPNTGDWAAIVISSTGTANFSYSKISYGGAYFNYSPYYADIYNDGGNLSIINSVILSSATSGITHAGGTLSVTSTTFQGNTTGINAFGLGTVSLIGNTFTNNTKAGTFSFQNGLRLSASGNTASGTGMNGFGISGTISTTQTWNADGIPFVVTENFTIPTGVTLTLNPGTIVKIMPSGQWGQILFSIQGALSAIGTQSQNITFTSYKDDIGGDTNGNGASTGTPGDWAAIVVNSTGTANFSYAIISYGGAYFSYGPYVADVYNDGGNLSLTNSTISLSANSGIVHSRGTTNISQSSIHDNVGYGINNVTTVILNAKNNYWGSLNGPTHVSNPLGTGDRVSDYVNFEPYLKTDPTKEPEKCIQDCYSVMFIPGIAGSQIYRNSEEKPAWLPDLLSMENADVQSLFLDANGSSIRTDITTKDGEVLGKAYGWSDIYQGLPELLNSLKNQNVIADWKAISYDWRLDYEMLLENGNQTGDRVSYLNASSTPYILQELKRLASIAKDHKVIIIGHSNGGLLAKALVKKLEDTNNPLLGNIEQVVMVATPQLGAPKSLLPMLHGGENPLAKLNREMMSDVTYRQFAENMPTMFNLLPSYAYNIPSKPYVQFDEPTGYAKIKNKAEKKYGVYDMDPLLNQMRSSYPYSTVTRDNLAYFLTGEQGTRTKPTVDDLTSPNVLSSGLFGDSVNVHANLDTYQFPSSIKVTQVAGWGLPTISGVEYFRGESDCVILGFLICKPTFSLDKKPMTESDGDSTVTTMSALAMDNATNVFVDLNTYNKDVNKTHVDHIREHSDIIGSQPVKIILEHLIKNESLDAIPYTKAVKPSGTHYIMAEKHSPVDIDVYDSVGNHTGYVNKIIDGVSVRVIEENIPNSSYIEMGGSAYVIFPANEGGEVKLTGTGDGSMNFKLTEEIDDVVTATTAFEDVPITPLFSGSIIVDTVANATPFSIDQNGDGNPDISITPKLNDVVIFDSEAPQTTATASGTLGQNGWYTSDVSVAFSATDEESGVKSTFYSTDKGMSWKIAEPFLISTEDTTTIQYYSTDNAGNKEATSTLEVKIDKTAPEAKISVDATTKDLKIEGVDMNPTTITKDVSNTYTITDLAGHTTKLFFQKTFLGKLLTFAKLTGVQYDTAVKVILPSSSFVYLWNPLVNPPILLSQTIAVNNTYAIEALYVKKQDQTTVLLKNKGVQVQKQVFTGLRIVKLTLNKGVVGYEI